MILHRAIDRCLMFYVIYFDPKDFPGMYVVRRHRVARASVLPEIQAFWIGESLDEARARVPEGSICIPRDKEDEPQIVESWV